MISIAKMSARDECGVQAMPNLIFHAIICLKKFLFCSSVELYILVCKLAHTSHHPNEMQANWEPTKSQIFFDRKRLTFSMMVIMLWIICVLVQPDPHRLGLTHEKTWPGEIWTSNITFRTKAHVRWQVNSPQERPLTVSWCLRHPMCVMRMTNKPITAPKIVDKNANY